MPRFVISVAVTRHGIYVDVSRNGAFFDEAEFETSDEGAFISYMKWLAERIYDELEEEG
ncbi:hypothetical protein [Pyrodictium delaneyi]|uniref:hypothetical protein n=1 Tax=Pyrodictium delaneyi TaxID=1273541 RepID=UPI0012E23A70|nr:hypothetical protein [Pyrodictium delaneyi]